MIGTFWRALTGSTLRAVALVGIPFLGMCLFFSDLFWHARYTAFGEPKTILGVISLALFIFVTGAGGWIFLFLGRFKIILAFWVFIVLSAIFTMNGFGKLAGAAAIVPLVGILFFEKEGIEIFISGLLNRISQKKKIIQDYVSENSETKLNCEILILTASSGSGHLVAAKNISEELKKINKRVLCLNVFDYIPNSSRKYQENIWEYLQNHYPNLYRPVHRFVLSGLKKRVEIESEIAADNIKGFLGESPSVIVATHPMAVAIGSEIKKRTGSKLIVVPTDFYFHPHYIASNTDIYCLPANDCIFYCIEKEKIKDKKIVTGIPISSIYSNPVKRDDIVKKYNISPKKKIVFVSFGGAAILRLKVLIEMMSLIIFNERPIHFLLSLSAENPFVDFLQDLQNDRSSVSVVEKNDTPYLLMIADVMIGKPGGISVSEALALRLPIGIWAHGGPEDFNTKFLIKNGFGRKIGGLWDLVTDFKRTKKWIESAQKLPSDSGYPDSAKKIAEIVLAMSD